MFFIFKIIFERTSYGTTVPKMAPPTPMVRPLDESQGSSPLQGHGSWLVCEVTLNNLQLHHNNPPLILIPFTLERNFIAFECTLHSSNAKLHRMKQ